MRFAVVALSLLASTAQAQVPVPEVGVGTDFGTGTNNEGSVPPKDKYGPAPDEIDLVVRYRGGGDVQALAGLSIFSTDGTLTNLSSRRNIVSMRVNKQDVEEVLNNPLVEYAEPDYAMQLLPYEVEEIGQNQPLERRRLPETKPYGISMVEADQVGLPPGTNRIKNLRH